MIAAVVLFLSVSVWSGQAGAGSDDPRRCGKEVQTRCTGSYEGQCCGPYGSCGTSEAFCSHGCQVDWGRCDWACGSKFNKGCDGSAAGQCCSQHNWCGATDEHCGSECQPRWGRCNGHTDSYVPPTGASTTSTTREPTTAPERAPTPTPMPPQLPVPEALTAVTLTKIETGLDLDNLRAGSGSNSVAEVNMVVSLELNM